MHSETLTQRNSYTQNNLHKKHLCTKKNTETGTHRNFHKQKLIHTEEILHRNFYTQLFLPKKTFTQRNFYTQTHLHTVAFTHRSFCTEKSLPISHHVSFFMIIHHLSSSFIRFHALLVNSLHRLVIISHSVLSVYASFSLPLRRSKLNENSKINNITTRKMG